MENEKFMTNQDKNETRPLVFGQTHSWDAGLGPTMGLLRVQWLTGTSREKSGCLQPGKVKRLG